MIDKIAETVAKKLNETAKSLEDLSRRLFMDGPSTILFLAMYASLLFLLWITGSALLIIIEGGT